MSFGFVHTLFVVNLIEFYATFTQVRGKANYKTRFNPQFSTYEMPVPRKEYDSCFQFI